MKYSVLAMGTAGVVWLAAACSPNDDHVEVQPVEEVHTPAPVMPMDTMMQDTVLHDMHDTIPAPQ